MSDLKRLLIHVAGTNLGLLLRNLYGIGTPRGLQGLSLTLRFVILLFEYALESEKRPSIRAGVTYRASVPPYYQFDRCSHFKHSQIQKRTSTTDC